MAGFTLVTVPTDAVGNIDMEALQPLLGPEVAGIMLTMPTTLGLFDPNTAEICRMIHEAGGLVYGDGANLNALLGRARLGDMGFDIVHINVHKTFSTPHGGGGPGAGPVCVKEHLAEFLPTPHIERRDDGMLHLAAPATVCRAHRLGGGERRGAAARVHVFPDARRGRAERGEWCCGAERQLHPRPAEGPLSPAI